MNEGQKDMPSSPHAIEERVRHEEFIARTSDTITTPCGHVAGHTPHLRNVGEVFLYRLARARIETRRWHHPVGVTGALDATAEIYIYIVSVVVTKAGGTRQSETPTRRVVSLWVQHMVTCSADFCHLV